MDVTKLDAWFVRRSTDCDWFRRKRKWFAEISLQQYRQSKNAINTSFQLTENGNRRIQALQLVNTRTSDMEFSPDERLLAVGSSCIRAGFVSVIRSSDLRKDDSLINPMFNAQLESPTVSRFRVSVRVRVDSRNPLSL